MRRMATRGFFGRQRAPAGDGRAPAAGAVLRGGLSRPHRRPDAAGARRASGASRSRAWSPSHEPGAGTRRMRCRGSSFEGDIHCVTRWSKLGTSFRRRIGGHAAGRGRRRRRAPPTCWRSVTAGTRPTCRWPTFAADGPGSPGSTKGARCRPSMAVQRGCWSRTCTSGSRPNGSRDYGLLDHDERGFWENYGYHDYGDPWKEQRFQGD